MLLLIGGYLALRTSPVQTWLAQQLAGKLSEDLGVEVKVERVDLEWLRTISIEGVYIGDQHQDTLLYSDAVKGRISELGYFDKELGFSRIQLERPHVELKRYPTDSTLNLDFLLQYFSPEDTISDPWDFQVSSVGIRNGSFVFHDPEKAEKGKKGVDFKDLRIHGIQLEALGIRIAEDSVATRIKDLAFVERNSGFDLDSLSSKASYSTSGIRLDDLLLRTSGSKLDGKVHFLYEDPEAMGDWVEKVDMELDMEPSRLASQDLAYFVEDLWGMKETLQWEGKIRGTVSELRGDDLLLGLSEGTYFQGDIELSGLPDIGNTFMSIEAERIQARQHDLEQIPVAPFGSDKTLQLPPQLNRLGDMTFEGRFTGFIRDFVAYGTFHTELGGLRTDLAFSQDTGTGRTRYEGTFKTLAFDVGSYYRIPDMGKVDARMEVKGSGVGIERIDTELKGSVNRFRYKNYDYKDLKVEGRLHNSHFTGSVAGNDPNFDFAFNGSIDLRKDVPRYSFTMKVNEVRPGLLNWMERDSSIALKTRLEFEGKGADLRNLDGKLGAYGTVYRQEGLRYELGDIELKAGRTPTGRSLRLISDPLIASVEGRFDLQALPGHFSDQLRKVLPSLFETSPQDLKSEQDFTFKAELIEDKPLFGLLLPEWELAENTVMSGSFNSREDAFQLTASAPYLVYQGRRMSGLQLNMNRQKDILEADLVTDTLSLGDSLNFHHLHFMAKALSDNLQLQTEWTGGEPRTKGSIESVLTFSGQDRFEFEVLSSAFRIRGKEWHLRPNGKIMVDPSAIHFKGLHFGNADQGVALEGKVSQDPQDEVVADFNEFKLGILAPFLPDKLEPSGTVKGKAVASDLYGTPLFKSDIRIEGTELAGHELGLFQIKSNWLSDKKMLSLKGSLEKDERRTLSLNGSYSPEKEEALDVELKTDGFMITPLNVFIDGGISDIEGNLTGPLRLTGDLSDPILTGKVTANDVSLKVDALNVTYGFDGQTITFYEDMIGFDYIPVHYVDPKTGGLMKDHGRATATLIHNHFKEWNFNIFLEMDRMLAMNLDKKMNDLYYGTAYGSGTLEIYGSPGTLNITVDARTDEGTDIKLPLGGNEEVRMENFVSFVDRDAPEEKKDPARDLEGIEMNFDLEVTPEARVSIIFDEKIGDVMKGRGSGNIKMEVNTNGKFNMYGKYEVHEGDYLFTMQNVINKRFSVQKGGTIEWYGDPYEAILNLDAVYDLRTSIFPLMQGFEGDEAYKRRIPVELVMHLSRELMNPEVAFDIRFPTLSEDIKTMAMSRIESTNKQAFSLLVLKRFIDEQGNRAEGTQGVGVGASASSTSTELLSNQLSNWLSSISKEFDLGVNYRPGDEVTDEELAVALSTQLFNERVSFSGNFGVSSSSEYSQQNGRSRNNLVGDFTIQYDITEDGKFRLKVYNESNEDRLTQLQRSDYTQGVGLYYQESFDSARELFKGVRKFLRGDKKDKDGKGKEEEAPETPDPPE